MDYRDWGREELARRERYPADAWATDRERRPDDVYELLEDEGLSPGGPYAPNPESYPTPSRRRGAGPSAAQRYTPAWASEPEAVPAPRGGRHHRDDPPAAASWHGDDPLSGSRWENTDTAAGWQRDTATDRLSAGSEATDTTTGAARDNGYPGVGRSSSYDSLGTTSYGGTGTYHDTNGSTNGSYGSAGVSRGDPLGTPTHDHDGGTSTYGGGTESWSGRRATHWERGTGDDPLAGDPPRVGRRRATETDAPAGTEASGRRRAVGGRAVESPAAGDLTDEGDAAEGIGRRRAASRRHALEEQGQDTDGWRVPATRRRRTRLDESPEPPLGHESPDDESPTASAPGQRWAQRRATHASDHDDLDPVEGGPGADRPRDGRWDRSSTGARGVARSPAPRRSDRGASDDHHWARAAPRMDDDPADESPTRGTGAVGRSTVAPRARGAARYGPRQRRPDYAAEAEAPPAGRASVKPDEDEEVNGDRRGRFIEATGWGRSADTSAWKLAATDDRLYRRPDAARRSRDGDGTRRGRAPGDGGGQRRSARQRAEPGRGPRGRGEPEGRERDRITEPEGRSPASGQDAWEGRGADGAGDRRSPRAEPPADRPIRSGSRTGAERPLTSRVRDVGRTAPTSGAAGWRDAPTSSAGWGRPADTGQWDRSAETGRWDGATDTGQWDRFTDTTEWRRDDLSGLLPRDDEDGGPWQDSEKTFWSGTRLAGDDPRWMETPDSAPRSPVAAFSAPPRARQAPPERPARAVGAARTTGTARVADPAQAIATRLADPALRSQSTYPARRGLEAMPTSWRSTRRIEDDLLDADPGSPLAAVLYTAAWYAVPVLVFFVWLLTLDGSVPAGCVTDVTGVGCDSDRAKATASLLSAAPRFGLALMVSLVVAVLLRWASGTWRSGSVGLAAAVVGGGLSTVLISVISGQSLG